MRNFGMDYATKAPGIKSISADDKRFLQSANCTLVEVLADQAFKSGQFLRTKMGEVTVEIGLVGPQSAAVRIKDGNGKGKDAVVMLPSVEDALFRLEKDIVRDTEFFGEADNHRPMSMMQCMVAVIKQNLLSALRALGAGSSRTVTENLTNDGVINADDDQASAPKERRFVTIWP